LLSDLIFQLQKRLRRFEESKVFAQFVKDEGINFNEEVLIKVLVYSGVFMVEECCDRSFELHREIGLVQIEVLP